MIGWNWASQSKHGQIRCVETFPYRLWRRAGRFAVTLSVVRMSFLYLVIFGAALAVAPSNGQHGSSSTRKCTSTCALACLWPIYRLSTACLSLVYGLSMAYLWPVYGLSMTYLWPIYGLSVYGLSMASLRPVYGLSMAYLWPVYRLSIACLLF